MEDVLDVYQRPYDPSRPVVCIDETNKQLIIEKRVPCKPGEPEKLDSVYVRNGVADIFMISEPLAGKRETVVKQTRTAIDFAEILRYTADELYPKAEKIILVTDNLNIHAPSSLYKAFSAKEANRLTKRFEWHYTSKSFTHAGIRTASQYAIQCAKEAGALIFFDPNLREPLWENLEDARKAIEYGMECCDILKISDNELTFMTGEKDYDKGAVLLQQKYQIPLVCVTLGKDGSRAYYKGLTIKAEPFLQKNTIETTGAGDTFTGCMLNTVLDKGLDNLTGEDIRGMLRFANAGAALITTKRGALRVMPEKEEIESLLEEQTE